VTLPAIEATCKPLGILPTGVQPNGQPHYTLPAIIDRTDPSNPIILSDSITIIEYLESTYPSAPGTELFPGGTKAFQVLVIQFVVVKIFTFVSKLAMGALYRSKPPSERQMLRARFEAPDEKPLEEFEAKGAERETVWKELEQTMKFVQDAFNHNESGVFLMGHQVTCADFALCAALIFFKEISPDDLWAGIASWDGGRWERYVDAFKDWMAVDNYPAQ
jgi:glutathione S-transferase